MVPAASPGDFFSNTLPADSAASPAQTTPELATTPRSFMPPFAPGVVVKHYELIRELGAGGMGLVFLARDTRLGRLVAIKFLLEHSGQAAQRFLIEARTTAKCRHDNIVVIYEVDEIQEHPYMVLEYVEGRTLRAVMDESSADRVQAAVGYMLPVARALMSAHAMGIVHRDLKPENILISNGGQVKVLDFGIAKQMTAEIAQTLVAATQSGHNSMGITQDGALVGTMPYMSPEQWQNEPVDARTDLWAVGLILFELATGAHPMHPLSLMELLTVQDMDTPMPSAQDQLPHAPKLARIIDQCLRKKKGERFATAKELVAALEELDNDGRRVATTEDENPYTGLSAFQESDAKRFYGRDHDIAAVLGRLRNQQMIAVAGASGTGKSSFVRAGVIPAYKRAGSQIETFTVRPGRTPLTALADILAFFADTSIESSAIPEADPGVIAETLRTQPGYLGARLRARCRRKGPNHRILLFVDQLEELCTQSTTSEERTAFYACLEGVADDASSPLRVIVTVRADFLDRLVGEGRFSEEVTRGLYFLPPMPPAGLRDAIKKPLEGTSFRFEDEALVDEMLHDIEGMKCPLPILQFAATQLWEARDRKNRCLTREAYQAMGGVVGALSTHADAVLTGMSPKERQLVRAIFLRLVTAERTRAVVPMEDIAALDGNAGAAEAAVQNLANARLLTTETSHDQSVVTVELAHESLIERWGKLKQWLDESEQDGQFVSELRHAAAQWEKNGEDEGFLWRDRAALDAQRWLARRQDTPRAVGLAKREERYLDAVVQLAQRTRRRKRLVAIAMFAAISAVAVIVSVFAIAAKKQAVLADGHARRAEEQSKRADEQAANARDEALQARNATRLAAARELERDPTMVLAILREVEGAKGPARWADLARWALHSELSSAVLSHPDAVSAAAWSPDNKHIATACVDNIIRIWFASGLGEPVLLRGHDSFIRTIAWSPQGTHIATASDDKTVRVWPVNGRDEPIVLRGHEDAARSVAWSPDGKRIVSTSADTTARVWNADGSGVPIVLRGHEGTLRMGSWSPDGMRIATASFDKTARIWNADGSGNPIVLRGHEAIVRTTAWSPDSTRIVTAAMDNTARIWNADGTGSPTIVRHDDQVLTAVFSPDGTQIVTASGDKTARVWRVDDTGNAVILRGHENALATAFFTMDGKSVVTASLDATARVWPLDGTSEPRSFRGHASDINAMVQRPDGKQIATVSADNTVRIWSLDAVREQRILGRHDDDVEATAWSPDGTRIASTSTDKTLRIWFVEGKQMPIVLRGHDAAVVSAAWSPDSTRIVTASFDATARVWKASGQDQPTVLRGHAFTVEHAAFSPDGSHILTVSDDKTARIWNADGTGEPLIFQGHDNRVLHGSWSPDGIRFVTASMDMTVRIWNANGQGTPVILRGHTSLVTSAAWSPDGKRIASASYDKTLRIWNADGQGEPLVLRGHDAGIAAVVWSADGQRILTTSMDATMRIYHADGTGEPLVLRGSNQFGRASFSPDGRRIAVGSQDKSVAIWSDLEPLHGASEPRLWTATSYCMPVDQRIRILGVSEQMASAQQQACLRHVAEAHSTRAP